MAKTPGRKVSAETMAQKQREISVSEFFAKNRHLLGFDNPRKALLTTVKEAVDNSLDACEEAGILPDIEVIIEEVTPPPSPTKPGRYRVTIGDNGPGIVRKQVEHIFGRLLYGSKFHRLKMSRGQQGIGISAAGMYGLMTTGRPMIVETRPHKSRPAHHIELAMDTTKNRPEVTRDDLIETFPATSTGTGTRVTIELEARYQRGKASVDAYLEQTAIANPHAKITFVAPKRAGADEDDTARRGKKPKAAKASAQPGETLLGVDGESASPLDGERDGAGVGVGESLANGSVVYPRAIEELPAEPVEIKPHPYGVELGAFLQMLQKTEEKQLAGFFKNEFCRIAPSVAAPIYKAAGVTGQTWVSRIDSKTAEKIYRELQASKLRAPPTDCLSPIGVRQLLAGLLKGVKAEFYAASTRTPEVYRGMPFQIEAAVAFGGDLPSEESARVIRFANRVPLLYQQSACSAFKSVTETGWRSYGLQQPRGGAPVGPLVIMIHMASVWVPFTSESKEAIADYDEIRKEMRLALQECGRKLGTYLRKRQKMKRESQRRDVFERYIGEIAKACNVITGADAQEIYDRLLAQARRRTAIADAQLDEDGKVIEDHRRLEKDDGVVIVGADDPDDAPPTPSAMTKQTPQRKHSPEGRSPEGSLFGGDDEGDQSSGAQARRKPGPSKPGATKSGASRRKAG